MTDVATSSAMEKREQPKLETFRAPASKWWQAIAFLLTLSLLGLQFYPAFLAIIIFFLWRWRWISNRYDFIVEIMIFFGSFGYFAGNTFPFVTSDIAVLLGLIGFLVYRKNRTVKHITYALLCYFIAVIAIAMTSVESISVQAYRMRHYFAIIAFFIPLLTFANRKFEWDQFINSVVLHALVICGFYVVDTYIIGGFILMPNVHAGGIESTFNSPYITGFLSLPRHYPTGLFWLIPCVIWLNEKRIRFSTLQWIVILLALFATRTNSLYFALIGCWIISRPKFKEVVTYALIGVVTIVALYFVDSATGRYLRLADNIEQFTSLGKAQDEEDIAEFGSGRMAQIIPKWLLLEELDRVDLGFGFIHPEKTTNPIFMIHNEFYTDVTQADEVATAVEVSQVQTIFDIGVIGLIIQTTFFFGIFFIIRRLRHARDYLNAIIGVSLLGIGGFSGFIGSDGQILIATILGAILLVNKKSPQPILSTDERQ